MASALDASGIDGFVKISWGGIAALIAFGPVDYALIHARCRKAVSGGRMQTSVPTVTMMVDLFGRTSGLMSEFCRVGLPRLALRGNPAVAGA
ncbi:MAG: hypothetical protein O2923_09555 [Verrucomicrobia bacterium]|nr:hypothetical protein [Verrucomicrobiota bacterium]